MGVPRCFKEHIQSKHGGVLNTVFRIYMNKSKMAYKSKVFQGLQTLQNQMKELLCKCQSSSPSSKTPVLI